MKEEKGKVVQICYLTKEETNDPSSVIREFTEDLSLETVRRQIVAMRNICSTTDNVTYIDPKAREDLFYVTDKMLRFFEASYLQEKKINFQVCFNNAHIRQLTVLEKQILKNVKNVPNSVPCLSLYGKWMATAGFLPGREVTIVAEQDKIFITLSKEWDKIINAVKIRA